ncbi:MAG: hypothetical protein LUC31_01930 [Coprobacillus sp.]|nr:hypothetical protein [Coprobacillus sp.]
MQEGYEVILAIVNAGSSEVVVNAARSAGANGGTILHGRGSLTPEAAEELGLAISPDKEVIMILVKVEIRDAVLQAINEVAGLQTNGNGIAMSLPCTDVVGLNFE